MLLQILKTTQYQEQHQSIIVNINGQNVEIDPNDIEQLNNRIVNLETENMNLKNRQAGNADNIANLSDVANIDVLNYQLFINGIEQSIVTNSSVIEYNGVAYVRSDIISLIDNEFNLNTDDYRIVYGNSRNEKSYLTNVCLPYEKPGSFSTEPFIMLGDIYANGFSIFSSEYNDILFNLNNKYSTLEFDFGHVDNSGDYMCIANFYIDGEYIKTISKNTQDDMSHETIKLNYGKILRIEIITKEKPNASPLCAEYGFANAVLGH